MVEEKLYQLNVGFFFKYLCRILEHYAETHTFPFSQFYYEQYKFYVLYITG